MKNLTNFFHSIQCPVEEPKEPQFHLCSLWNSYKIIPQGSNLELITDYNQLSKVKLLQHLFKNNFLWWSHQPRVAFSLLSLLIDQISSASMLCIKARCCLRLSRTTEGRLCKRWWRSEKKTSRTYIQKLNY